MSILVNSPVKPPWQRIFDPNVLDWRAQAACRDYPNPDDFFPGQGQRGHQRAFQTCARCPVRDTCYEYGTNYGEQGIWGGAIMTGKKTTKEAANGNR